MSSILNSNILSDEDLSYDKVVTIEESLSILPTRTARWKKLIDSGLY
jgi:hypothetical protein